MALHFPLFVNETRIGYFYARRIEGGMEVDSINRYRIQIWTSTSSEGDLPNHDFEMNHRYGDGAWVLIKKALIKAESLSAHKKAWNPRGITQDEFLLALQKEDKDES